MGEDRKQMTIRNYIHHDVARLSENDDISVAIKAIAKSQYTAGVVVRDEKLVGIFTEKDIVRLASQNRKGRIGELMTKNPIFVSPDASIDHCVKLLQHHKIRHLPVCNGEAAVGIVSNYELMSALLEVRARQIAEAERVNRQLTQRDEYISIVAHDLRSPLGVIDVCVNYIRFVAETKPLSDEQEEFLTRIQRNVQKSLSMISSLLDLGRIDAGNQGLVYSDEHLPKYLTQIVENMRFLAADKELTLNLGDIPNLLVCIDKELFRQVIENLIGNAIKFTKMGKTISVASKFIPESDGSHFGNFEISVTDQGPGISQEKYDQIFGKFEQLGEDASKKLGVGLGLSIAQKFVQFHGGSIRVDSDGVSGSTFTVNLPGATKVADEVIPEKKKTILVMDDDVEIRELLEAFFKENQFAVVLAKDGFDGFQKFKRQKPDLVFSDIKMPNLDGFEILQRIKLTDPQIPFILASGYYPSIDADIAKNVFKADAILRKPFKMQKVLQTIEELLHVDSETEKAS